MNKLFNILKINKNKLMIKIASKNDINIIFNLIIEGAKYNSFNNAYLDKETHSGLLDQITRTIKEHKMPISIKKTLASIIYVLKKGSKTIGFIWLRYHTVDTCELYMASITSSKRNNGYGHFFFFEILKLISTKYMYSDIYYTSESSKIIKTILIKLGFNQIESNRRETFRLEKEF